MKFYIVPNLTKENAAHATDRAVNFLTKKKCTCFFSEALREVYYNKSAVYIDEKDALSRCDIIISVGGDGTVLHLAPNAIFYNKPMLGINAGHVGFLATVEENEIEEKLSMLLSGSYIIDERQLLEATTDSCSFKATALNEFVLYKGSFNKTVCCSIYCDDTLISSFRSDGVIVSTPTGSTAYSLSAGGPILDAKIQGIVLTPICAHSLNTPPMVFSAARSLKIQISCADPENFVVLSADGRDEINVPIDETVNITVSDKTLKFLSLDRADQFKAIDKKLKGR